MRCQTARRRISDELDGSLRPGRRPGLEAHLRCCPACRAYREDLARIQAAAQRADEPDAFWAGFEARLGARTAAAEAGPAPPPAETWIAWDDVLDPVVQAAETSPDLAGRIDREIQASYEALLPGGDAAGRNRIDEGHGSAHHAQFNVCPDKGPSDKGLCGPHHLHGLDGKSFGVNR